MAQHLETSQIYAKYSKGAFTEELIETVVPLKVKADNIKKDSMLISFTMLEKDYRL